MPSSPSARLGVSKRIAHKPKNLELGKTPVYLAHPKAIENKVERVTDNNGNGYLIPGEDIEYKLGIFTVFVPNAIEMPMWKSKLTKRYRVKLEKQGITPIEIPDGEIDHDPKPKKKRRK